MILPALTTLVVGAGAVFIPSAFAAPGPSSDAVEPSATPADPPVTVRVEQKTPAQLRAIWTPERLRQAEANPVDVPAAPPAGAPKAADDADETAPTLSASAPAVAPKAARSTASVSAQATVSVSQRVPNPRARPTSAVGRLYFQDAKEEGYYTCTATAITSRNKNTAWTAGHCVHRGSGGESGWYRNHIFIPARDGYDTGPYGYWYGSRTLVPTAWPTRGDTKDSDMGAIVLTPPGSTTLEDAVGAYGYTFGGSTAYASVRTYGYPEKGYNRPDSDFAEGEYMMFCEGNTVDAATSSATDDRLRMSCDMGAGSSGGPLATGVGTNNIRIVGTNSSRDIQNGKYINNWLYSSNHGANAVELINRVNNS
ncbi:trypsin-like serine peptidase [Jidongwangia harbinensis]|uniref:trypsin-like serine peptidase n=1 Tax=Jidongwangia harbinensis TaxID=2878561 RepID=UPI001CD99AD9|nr:hypothetical protein [Jidongwangia harbinensis]MCA2218437.1 hypothetical protein [Jidongwangia harbinensis]